MDVTEALRLQIKRLIDLGVTQKTIAAKMGVDTSQLSKWVRGEEELSLRFKHVQGYRHFLSEVQKEVTVDVTALSTEELERLEAEREGLLSEQEVRRRVNVKGAKAKGRQVARR